MRDVAKRTCARSKSDFWISLIKVLSTAAPRRRARATIFSLGSLSRRLTTHEPAVDVARADLDRAPARPFCSHSKCLAPGRKLVAIVEHDAEPRVLRIRGAACRPASTTLARSSSLLKIGTITTWMGASFGGSTRPSSSECVMISPPISAWSRRPTTSATRIRSRPPCSGTSRRRPCRSSAPDRGWCPPAAPCRPASSPRCR